MNGNDVIVYEEKYCDRLQLGFLRSKCFDEEDVELLSDKQVEELICSSEYWDFVLEDMEGRE